MWRKGQEGLESMESRGCAKLWGSAASVPEGVDSKGLDPGKRDVPTWISREHSCLDTGHHCGAQHEQMTEGFLRYFSFGYSMRESSRKKKKTTNFQPPSGIGPLSQI